MERSITMDQNPVIIVENVTKIYPQKPQLMKMREDTFLKFLSKKLFGRNERTKDFVALDNVSFTVYPGESVGIIGYNGAGKSTLLRVLSGITAPTKGSVSIHGKFGELFALNSGFNKDLSGRKNIYLIAAIKGISENEIEQRMDSIIDFSELGDFIDQPVKIYSSGMRGRLGFSILIHLLPDIIFIDEALATGDQKFKEKCQDKLDELMKADKTMVLVSHAAEIIKASCTRAIWLDQGKIRMDGEPKKVVRAYRLDRRAKEEADV
jgi:ABC-type polysaccharide/polyol phosphate transport system ATPase subunit